MGHFIPWLATIGSVSPLHRPARHRARRHQCVHRHRDQGLRQHRRGRAGCRRGAHRDGGRAGVAIPAVFGYNIFASQLNRLDSELEGFGTELIALMVREGRI